MKPYQVVVLGSGCVGKTSLVERFINGFFTYNYRPTLEDSYRHTVQLPDGLFYVVEILDTAGMHQFPAMKELSIKSGHAFILVYSVDDEESFQEVLNLRDLIIQTKGRDDMPIIVVGNKLDQDHKRKVNAGYAEEKAAECNCVHMETSARFNINVETVFVSLLTKACGVDKKLAFLERSRSKRLSKKVLFGQRRQSDHNNSCSSPDAENNNADNQKCVIL